MADPTLSAKVAALESQLNSLRLQLRGSPGVSTGVAGAMNIRTLQLGFAAELTSTFDQATGYSWKRLRLEPPELLNPGVQPTGLNAFEVSGDETLQSGTRVWMEPSPDAVGYLFSVGIPGAGGQDPACKSFLSLPECATLEVVEAYGACGCITTGQTASLTRSGAALASDDLLYGCPPGITDADCPNGAPSKFNLVVAGFTGGSTGYNGNWTLSYTATPTPRWTQTRGDVTWFATVEAGGNATLRGGDGVSDPSYEDATVATCCESLTLSLDDGGSSEDPPATLTLTPATACGSGPAYTPYLSLETDECGDCLRLLWIPVAGSGAASIRWRPIGCGVDGDGKRYAEFASDSSLICTDDAEECGENYVVVRVTCEPCACFEADCIGVEWTAAGWYQVAGECCKYFATEGDVPDGVVLCGGPLETDEICRNYILLGNYLDCEDPCIDTPLPIEMCVTLSNANFTVYGVTSPALNALLEGLRITLRFEYSSRASSLTGCDGDTYPDPYPMWYGATTVTLDGCVVDVTVGLVPCCPREPSGAFIGFINVLGSPFDDLCSPIGAYTQFNYIVSLDPLTIRGNSEHVCSPWHVSGLSESVSDPEAPGYASTNFDIYADCIPPVASYNCVNGTCVELYDGSGEYATEAECTSACEGGGGGNCCDVIGQTATVVIPDGANAGTYLGIWMDDPPDMVRCSVSIPGLNPAGSTCLVYVRCDGTYAGFDTDIDTAEADTIDCGPPQVLTFPGTAFAATGDVTVTT